MKLSFNWLKEHVSSLKGISAEKFCSRMTMTGSKVETYEPENVSLKKVVAGKVITIEKHPNAEKLVVCKVDVTDRNGGILQIITGARNLKEGDIVPVALNGSVLPGNVKIKKSNLRGEKSEGMMCSLEELGINKENYCGSANEGILVLPAKTTIGEDIQKVLGLDDVVIDFEITPNRPDCLSVIGLSREAAVTFGTNLVLNDESLDESLIAKDDRISLNLHVDDFLKCPYYSAAVVKNIKIGESPAFMKKRLNLMGIKSINNVVDITNYVMLLYGQPLHAFDYNNINGTAINVRCAKEGETLITLDKNKLVLTPSDIVIANEKEPIALAGIMGGLYSGINMNTSTIVLESANFNPVCIRKSSKYHNIRTEASSRYEKGLPVENCKLAMITALNLIKKYCSNKDFCIDHVYTQGNSKSPITAIPFDYEFINKFLNISISKDQMINILTNLGFSFNGNNLIVPYFRKDVTTKYDMAEEIARIYGYNNITSTTLKGTHFSTANDYLDFKSSLCNLMTAFGLNETVTSPFESKDFYTKLLVPAKPRNALEISNPLGPQTSLMRPYIESSMLKVLANNFSYKNLDVSLFEIAKEYCRNANNVLPTETDKLVAGFYGNKINFLYVKGILEELFNKLGILDKVIFSSESSVPYYHGGICAKITLKPGNILGYIGKIHPTVCKNYKIEKDVYMFTLDVKTLFNAKETLITYKPVPLYPAIERDLSLICPEEIIVESLKTTIKSNAGNYLEKISLFDIYRGPQVADGKKSVAFNLVFRSKNRTLKDEEIESNIKNIVTSLNKIGAFVRT